MGNCLVLQETAIKVMKADGKILQYQAPIRVSQILSEFAGHGLSESVSGMFRHLQPEAKLISGRLYHLTPLPLLPSPKKGKNEKKVRFSDQLVVADGVHDQQAKASGGSVVRIKLVVTKQELQEMLLKGGLSVQDLVFKSLDQVDTTGATNNCRERKTVLESIPEMD